MRLAPQQEREVAFLSLKAQEALLELLQNPVAVPQAHAESLRVARSLLKALEALAAASSPVPPDRVPDAAVRASLEGRFTEAQQRSPIMLSLQDVRDADTVIQQLEAGQRPSDEHLTKCLHIFRKLGGYTESLRQPLDAVDLRDVLGG
jgi:hypothetical protein